MRYFLSTKTLSQRQARWAEELSQYNFVIRYKQGKKNTRADALSRRWDHAEGVPLRDHQVLEKSQDGGIRMSMDEWTTEERRVARVLKEGTPGRTPGGVTKRIPERPITQTTERRAHVAYGQPTAEERWLSAIFRLQPQEELRQRLQAAYHDDPVITATHKHLS